MRLMVTGATGFVGGALVERLEADGARGGPIINCAAAAHMGQAFLDPETAILGSVEATVKTLEHARTTGARVLHLSTDEQYGGWSDYGAEWGRLAPGSPYAAAKLCQEAVCLAYRASYDVPVTILTADLIVGPGQLAEKVVPTIARAIRAGQTVPIWTHRGEPAVRRFSTIANVADLCRFLLEHPGRRIRYSMPGETLSMVALAQRIAGLLDLDLHYRYIDSELRPGYPRSSQVEGWVAPQSFDEGLVEALS